MAEGDVETYYQDGAWHNRVEGSGTTALSFRTRAEAIEVGRAEAMKTMAVHVVRELDGRIAERASYGHDKADAAG